MAHTAVVWLGVLLAAATDVPDCKMHRDPGKSIRIIPRLQAKGRCCLKSDGEMFASKLRSFGGDVAKLLAWRPSDTDFL